MTSPEDDEQVMIIQVDLQVMKMNTVICPTATVCLTRKQSKGTIDILWCAPTFTIAAGTG
jgi:hypothetical protein